MGIAAFLFGTASYAVFLATFLYAIGFVGNLLVPKSIDSGAAGTLPGALLVDLLLLGLFAAQHSVMARPWFKERWMRLVPRSVERSTYVLASSLALALLFWQWQPIPGTLWEAEGAAARAIAYGLFALGWVIVLSSTFMINHFDLFGLRQVWLFLRDKPYTHLPFKTPALYSRVRHPLYLGWFIGFWATPTMSGAHLLFAVVTTVYILAAIQWEERDLVKSLPGYAAYRKRVPMLLPFTGGRKT